MWSPTTEEAMNLRKAHEGQAMAVASCDTSRKASLQSTERYSFDSIYDSDACSIGADAIWDEYDPWTEKRERLKFEDQQNVREGQVQQDYTTQSVHHDNTDTPGPALSNTELNRASSLAKWTLSPTRSHSATPHPAHPQIICHDQCYATDYPLSPALPSPQFALEPYRPRTSPCPAFPPGLQPPPRNAWAPWGGPPTFVPLAKTSQTSSEYFAETRIHHEREASKTAWMTQQWATNNKEMVDSVPLEHQRMYVGNERNVRGWNNFDATSQHQNQFEMIKELEREARAQQGQRRPPQHKGYRAQKRQWGQQGHGGHSQGRARDLQTWRH